MEKVTIFGSITKDHKLKAVFSDQYQELLKNNAGKRLTMTLEIMEEDSTVLQRVYFEKVIVPLMQRGLREAGNDMTINETIDFCLDMCPATERRDLGGEISKDQRSKLIDWCIQICSIQFGIIVPDPI